MAIGAIKCVQLLIYVCSSARETRSATLHTSNKQAFYYIQARSHCKV